MIELNNITLTAVDNVTTDLLVMAMEDTLKCIRPAEILIWSDVWTPEQSKVFGDVPFRIFPSSHKTRDINDYCRVLWYECPAEVKTSHYITIHWDGWILDGTKWKDEYYQYDYVGAIWPFYKDNLRVGCAAPSLRSKKLMDFLKLNANLFPYTLGGRGDDDLLGRVYRPALELYGFVWAPEEVCLDYAFEFDKATDAFGFHGLWHFPQVLSRENLKKRVKKFNHYVYTHSIPFVKSLMLKKFIPEFDLIKAFSDAWYT